MLNHTEYKTIFYPCLCKFVLIVVPRLKLHYHSCGTNQIVQVWKVSLDLRKVQPHECSGKKFEKEITFRMWMGVICSVWFWDNLLTILFGPNQQNTVNNFQQVSLPLARKVDLIFASCGRADIKSQPDSVRWDVRNNLFSALLSKQRGCNLTRAWHLFKLVRIVCSSDHCHHLLALRILGKSK